VRKLAVFIIAVFVAVAIGAQEIVTAEKYLERVSDVYSGFRDYEAQIGIRSGDTDMYGTVSHRTPAFLRIDFSNPAEQVIIFNGEQLTVFLPSYRAILNQGVSGTGVGLATGNGLTLLRRNFAASFVTGPSSVKLDDSSSEMVVKLKLTRRYGSEGFREIVISINPSTMIIRRMVGITPGGALVQFDFTSVRTNIGIPEKRFIYDAPANSNVYNNFLFRDTE
jgi:outer membrane lipoprotein-sorting protein